MHPIDCPQWEYRDHPDAPKKLPRRVVTLLSNLKSGASDPKLTATDTRKSHLSMFAGLTPPGCDYYAGHYRGESLRCLEYCRVGVQGDPTVGIPPESVEGATRDLSAIVQTCINGLDAGYQLPDAHLDKKLKVAYTIAVACRLFTRFLEIHPYVNGNGHAARLLVVCILGRYGYWPYRWTVEPRPPDPPHTELIKQYRQGNTQPLETYIKSCLVP